jgi:two-component system LytT family sensor kinase
VAASALVAALVLGALAAVAALAWWLRTRRGLESPSERAAHATLRTASLAARPLRRGLTEESARAAAPFLQQLVGAAAVALADADARVLAWSGPFEHHLDDFRAVAEQAASSGRRQLVRHKDTGCRRSECHVRSIVAQPLIADEIVGVIGAVTVHGATPGLLRALADVARYAASQVELAELDASRERLARAEVQALRAQISPHFIYNALTTIASFVRTDPDRARDLVLEFADFTRYSFRTAGEFTTLAEELQNIDRYLTLERARFGPKLQVRLQVAPEVLGVVLPFLALQPLVENAVRHGLSRRPDGGTISISATDAGSECLISVEDDGAGMDPELLRAGVLNAPAPDAPHVGLANVDDRLRAAFGDDYGLVVETGIEAGTKISLRVPKFRSGVRA